MADTKAKPFLDVKMPGGTSFLLSAFKGTERLSSLFEYNLMMFAESRTVDFSTLMGQSATVTISVGSEKRSYNGIIGWFDQEGTPFNPLKSSTTYRAILYPKLWLLTMSGQCRIFQNKSTIDIIKSVLDEAQISYLNQVTTCGQDPLDFCVQYDETDFNFISRLMEREGIFYFFQQTQDDHKLVLADSPDAHQPCPNAATASFHDSSLYDEMMLKVGSCFITQRLVPQSNTLNSYNYLTPQTPLKSVVTGSSDAGGGSITRYRQIYDQKSRGDALAKVQLQSEELPQKMVQGVSTVPFFLAGYKFTLQEHPRDDANIDYVLYEVIHEAYLEPEGKKEHIYKNSYRAFPATIPFKSPQLTPKPRIYSTQTAKVTGKEGEEIYTEEYGRIKVKFHWDPSDKEDDTTSCWIRVATLWAGQTWGSVFTPRVGQEVVVSFIDGNPDYPLVVGSVYNGDNKPPYLPDEPTKSTIKSQTSKKPEEGTAGYNEFRFEDKKDSEEIYIHAQKDFKIDIQNDQTITLVGGSRTITLQAQEEQQEQRSGEKSNDSLTLKNGDKSLQIDQGDYSITLTQGNISVKCGQGNVNFDVTGDIGFKCSGNFSVNADQAIILTSGAACEVTAGGNFSADASGDASVSGGGEATLSVGANGTITAAGAIEVTGGGAVTVEGLTVEVTGGTISLNG